MKALIIMDEIECKAIRNNSGFMPGPVSRTLSISVDDEAAEVIKFFVDALMGRTKPMSTDQRNVTSP